MSGVEIEKELLSVSVFKLRLSEDLLFVVIRVLFDTRKESCCERCPNFVSAKCLLRAANGGPAAACKGGQGATDSLSNSRPHDSPLLRWLIDAECTRTVRDAFLPLRSLSQCHVLSPSASPANFEPLGGTPLCVFTSIESCGHWPFKGSGGVNTLACCLLDFLAASTTLPKLQLALSCLGGAQRASVYNFVAAVVAVAALAMCVSLFYAVLCCSQLAAPQASSWRLRGYRRSRAPQARGHWIRRKQIAHVLNKPISDRELKKPVGGPHETTGLGPRPPGTSCCSHRRHPSLHMESVDTRVTQESLKSRQCVTKADWGGSKLPSSQPSLPTTSPSPQIDSSRSSVEVAWRIGRTTPAVLASH